jgi:hypothetical protein
LAIVEQKNVDNPPNSQSTQGHQFGNSNGRVAQVETINGEKAKKD